MPSWSLPSFKIFCGDSGRRRLSLVSFSSSSVAKVKGNRKAVVYLPLTWKTLDDTPHLYICVFKWQDEGTGEGWPQSAHAPEPGKKSGNFDALARQKTHSGFTRPEQGARGAANRAGDRKENPPRFRPLRSPTRSLPGSLPDICSVGIFSGSRRNRAPSAPQPSGGEGEAAQKPLKKRQTAALRMAEGR